MVDAQREAPVAPKAYYDMDHVDEDDDDDVEEPESIHLDDHY